MSAIRLSVAVAGLALAAAVAFAGPAGAAERRFEPVPAAPAQVVTVVGTTQVVSANGTAFAGGASVLPMSTRKARLLVSFRNLGTAPIRVDMHNVEASSSGAPLAIASASAGSANGNENESVAFGQCMSVPKDLYSSCMANAVHKVHVDTEKGGTVSRQAAPDAVAIAPGKTQPMQFVLDLPKRSRGGPAALEVNLQVGGERLSFAFREVE